MKVNLFMKTAGFAICASLAFAFTACSDNVSVVKYESHEVEKQPSPSEVINSSSSAKGKASSSSKKSESSSSVAQSSSAKASSSSSAKALSSSSEKKPASSSSETPKSSAASSSSAGTSFFSENWRQTCLDKINEYRATENLEPLTLAPEEKQTCTDKQAGDDLASNKAHGHFGACGEGAQNSGPNFNTSWRKTAIEVSDAYLKMMWEDEKALVTSGERDPNKDEDYSYIGHYLNMKGNYKTVACGITLSEDGKKGWFNVNFFR
ncbi:CAP domain-containing protein [Fibrobacter sp. UWB12]|uniref:CAP domain-containing protein n=1 Tax=Fibrobacter sp. UWB12 TaxID=1896203 RepID=UPI0009239742|nr:CAP domain-containing protein [Fibrobacter sp. UWB12]SHK66842.1 Cysteine-rich secretory protein family protein [Fibrobacter sp. UWB12]